MSTHIMMDFSYWNENSLICQYETVWKFDKNELDYPSKHRNGVKSLPIF